MKLLTELRRPPSRLLLALALLAALTGAIILEQGGWRFKIAGVRVSMTSPWRAALIAAFCFILYLRWSPRAAHDTDAGRLMVLGRRPTALAILLSIAVSGGGWFWGSHVGGGADSSGYVSQAQLWREGRLVIEQPLIAGSPWPFAAETWAPLGFRRAARSPDALVPLYPPGLPLLMAAAQSVAGFCGAFLVVPICGALVIWLTYALGRLFFERPGIAVCGALLVATSPTFLFQLMNPMSDVPATAAWTLALVLVIRGRSFLAGLATAVAIAIRPNLVPLALVPLAWTALQQDWRSTIRLALGIAPGIAGIAVLNTYLYGSPWLAGYGSAADLYALGYGPTNLRKYISHFIDVETPIVAFAALFFVAPAFVDRARVPLPRLLSGGMAAGVALSYLFYQPYEEWTYLRFFLPMWPILMVLAAAGVFAVARRWAERASLLAAAVCIVFAALLGLDTASARGVFALWRGERKYADVARFIEEQTDPRAVLVSMQHSGSLRLYTGRLTLRYDVLEPNRLDHAVEYLASIDRRPYIVLDTWELDAFQRRFAASSRLGALDWTPIAALRGATWVFSTDPGRLSDTASIASSADDRWFCHTPVSER